MRSRRGTSAGRADRRVVDGAAPPAGLPRRRSQLNSSRGAAAARGAPRWLRRDVRRRAADSVGGGAPRGAVDGRASRGRLRPRRTFVRRRRHAAVHVGTELAPHPAPIVTGWKPPPDAPRLREALSRSRDSRTLALERSSLVATATALFAALDSTSLDARRCQRRSPQATATCRASRRSRLSRRGRGGRRKTLALLWSEVKP